VKWDVHCSVWQIAYSAIITGMRGGETTHSCVATSSNALQCVALYTNCIHGLRYTGTAGLLKRKNVGSKRREHSDVNRIRSSEKPL